MLSISTPSKSNNAMTSPSSSSSSSFYNNASTFKNSKHGNNPSSMVSPCSPTSSSMLSSSPMSPWSATGLTAVDHGSSHNHLNVVNNGFSSRSMPNSPNMYYPTSPLNLGAKLIGAKQSIDETLLKQLVQENMKHFTIVFDSLMNVGGVFLENFREFLSYERNIAPLEFLELLPTYK